MMKTKLLNWVYHSMKQRCTNYKCKHYVNYGGRGISVCDEWSNSFESFAKWANSNGYKQGLHIDRIENDGDYHPDNCRFITQFENNQNKRRYVSTGRFIGVTKRHRKYRSRIRVLGITLNIGTYSNEFDAAVARDSYVINNNLQRTLNFSQTEINL